VQQVEDAFEFWKDEADFGGRLHYSEIMRLAKDQDSESGEFIIVKREDRDPARYLPYRLQMIEADWLTDVGATPVGNSGTSYPDSYSAVQTTSSNCGRSLFSTSDHIQPFS
jgi:hypothetical protein